MKLISQLTLAACLLSLHTTVSASIVPSVDYTFGTGTESVFFVIDWNDGPDDNLNWQLNYTSGAYASVYEAMVDLDAQDTNLAFAFNTDFGAPFLEGMSFDDGSETHTADTTTDPLPRDWISFWTGPASGSTWTSSGTGVSDTPASSGTAYGLNYESDWNNPSSSPNAIPEPGMIALCLGGIGVFAWLRRFRDRS